MKTVSGLIKEDYNNQIKALAGLTDGALKGIIFFITEILKIKKYKLDIKYPPNDTQIIIHVFNESNEIYVKYKNPKQLDDLALGLGIPNYKIMFAERLSE